MIWKNKSYNTSTTLNIKLFEKIKHEMLYGTGSYTIHILKDTNMYEDYMEEYKKVNKLRNINKYQLFGLSEILNEKK